MIEEVKLINKNMRLKNLLPIDELMRSFSPSTPELLLDKFTLLSSKKNNLVILL